MGNDGFNWVMAIVDAWLGAQIFLSYLKMTYLTYKFHKKFINEGSHSEIGVLANFRKWKPILDGTKRLVYDGQEECCVNLTYACNVYYVGNKSGDDEKYMGNTAFCGKDSSG